MSRRNVQTRCSSLSAPIFCGYAQLWVIGKKWTYQHSGGQTQQRQPPVWEHEDKAVLLWREEAVEDMHQRCADVRHTAQDTGSMQWTPTTTASKSHSRLLKTRCRTMEKEEKSLWLVMLHDSSWSTVRGCMEANRGVNRMSLWALNTAKGRECAGRVEHFEHERI